MRNIKFKDDIVVKLEKMIYEPQNRIDVQTPKGDGFIWLVTEFGTETSKVFTVIQDNGEIWEWLPRDIIVKQNITFQRYEERRSKTVS